VSSGRPSGFWLFSRRPIVSEEELESIRVVARMNGFTTANLRTVAQRDPETGELCEYEGARIKPDI
jgi:lipocalin